MPRIRCHYSNCKYLDAGFCLSPKIEIDPYDGCLSFSEKGILVQEGVLEDDDLLEEIWDDSDYDDDEDYWLDSDDDL